MLTSSCWQEDNLQRVKKGDAKAGIHRMEIDRIRFMLSSYLRSRLQKVSWVTGQKKKKTLTFHHGGILQMLNLCLDWKVFPSCPGETKFSKGRRAVIAFAGRVFLCQRVSGIVFFSMKSLSFLASTVSTTTNATFTWPTGTTPTQRATWGLSHWGACPPTCRVWTCSKQVEFHLDSL